MEFGISVYPDIRPMEEIKEYIQLAAVYGCKRVFSSMWSVEGTAQEVLTYFRELNQVIHEHGMRVSLDVNEACMKKVGASVEDLSVFHEIGCDILRMDLPLPTEENLKLLANPYGICLELNASMGQRGADLIFDLIDRGGDVSKLLLCHNFYPQRYTGMKWQKFLDMNRRFSETGIPISAFLTSQEPKTHGVWDAVAGLCTVEKHRNLPLDLQAREMAATEHIDYVIIGNAYAGKEELQKLQESLAVYVDRDDNPMRMIMKMMGADKVSDENSPKRIVQKKLRVKLEPDVSDVEKEVLFDFYPHRDVGDSSEWIWRSRMPRYVYKERSIPVRTCEKDAFEPGDIVMINDNYKHYAAEVQIVLRPIANDGQRNLIGHLDEQEMEMLELIGEGDVVIFMV